MVSKAGNSGAKSRSIVLEKLMRVRKKTTTWYTVSYVLHEPGHCSLKFEVIYMIRKISISPLDVLTDENG